MLKYLKRTMSFTYPCPKKLREIMKMSLVERENKVNIKNIWEEYHKNKSENVAMVLDKD